MTANCIVPVTAVHQALARAHTRRKVGFKTRRDFLPITSPITQNGFFFFSPVRWSTVRLTPLFPFRPHRPHETFTEKIWGQGALDTKETALFAPDVDFDHPSIDHHEDGGV